MQDHRAKARWIAESLRLLLPGLLATGRLGLVIVMLVPWLPALLRRTRRRGG